jgi:mannose-6-phosphate isomerase
VAFNVLLDTFATHDTNARLWPQTERIKAWAALAEIAQSAPERDTCLQNAALAATGLWAYLSGLKGLWRDVMRPDGTFADDPSPATSLYHIVCAILELQRIQKPLRK